MVIRKISIGPDYKESMNYVVGQKVFKHNTICNIIERTNDIVIYIENEKKEVVQWKAINKTTPYTIEYNIDF